jgi:GH24 family phage-related lysozyme (muramidase)
MTTSTESNQNSATSSNQQGTSSSTATTSQTGTNTAATNMAQNTATTSKTGPTAAAMAILQKYGTNGLSQSDINKYLDPNLQSRISALTAQQQQNNSVQQNSLKGNSISQGALGGDRAQIAQAELMRGQGLNDASALAAEREKAYMQALTMATGDRSAALQAAGMMGTETSGNANTTGTSNSTGTSAMQGTQTSDSQFQSSGNSNTIGYSNTVSGPGSGWGTVAGVLGMLADGGRVQHRDMGGLTYAHAPVIPSLNLNSSLGTPPVQSYTLPKVGEHARKKINGMLDKMSGEQKVSSPQKGGAGGAPAMKGIGSSGGGSAPSMGATESAGSAGSGSGATAAPAMGTEGAAVAGEGAGAGAAPSMAEGAAAAGEGAAGAAEGAGAAAGEGAAAAGEGAAAAGEGAAAAGEGAAAAGEGIGEAIAAMFSDERVKENKRVIGKTFDGQQIYAFNYKGHPATQIGLMAQEVERHHPEAVGEQGGIKTVQYDVATHDAAQRGHFADGGYNGIGDALGAIPLKWRSNPDAPREEQPYVTPSRDPDAWRRPKAAPAQAWTPERVAASNIPAFQPGVLPSAESKDPSFFERMYLGAKEAPQPAQSAPPLTPAQDAQLKSGIAAGLQAATEPAQLTSAPTPQGVEQKPVQTFRVEPPASVIAPALGGKAEVGAPAVGEPATGISDNGVNFLKSKEGFSSRPHWDNKQTSIGYGVRAQPGEVMIDPDTAEERLRGEAGKVSNYLNTNAKVPLNQTQHDALVSFGFNLGTGKGGLADIMPMINRGDFEGAASKMLHYDHETVNGQKRVNDGLTKRRAEESAMLLGKAPETVEAPAQTVQSTPGGIAQGLKGSPIPGEAPSRGGLLNTFDAIRQKLTGAPPAEKQAVAQAVATGDKGGILKRLFGIDFNPLQLSDNERMALISGGFSGNAQVGANTYATLRGQDLAQAQHAAELNLRQQGIDQAKQSFGVIGQNGDGTPKYGFIDAAAGTLTPAPGSTGAPTGSTGLIGEEHLATLDPYIAEQARRVAQGLQKLPLPSKFNTSAAPVQRAVRTAYPDFNEATYDFMQKWNDPNKGSSGSVKAANTYYQHTAELYDLADKLPSSSNGKLVNTGKVWFKNQTNDPDLASYMDVAKQVAEEKLKTIKGGTPTKMEIEEAMKDYDPSKGKETIKKILAQDSKLIEGRTKNLEDDYNSHVSKHVPRLNVLNDESKAIRDKIGGKSSSNNIKLPKLTDEASKQALIKQGQEAIEIAVAKGAPRDKVTSAIKEQLRAAGAI